MNNINYLQLVYVVLTIILIIGYFVIRNNLKK